MNLEINGNEININNHQGLIELQNMYGIFVGLISQLIQNSSFSTNYEVEIDSLTLEQIYQSIDWPKIPSVWGGGSIKFKKDENVLKEVLIPSHINLW